MILNSPYITGSITVTGNANIQGQLTVTGSLSGTAATASFALTLGGTGSVGFATTGAFSATSGSASSRLTQIEQVYATTGSNSFRATQSITGSLTVTGQIIAQTINVQQVTSSIVYSSGSNVFGCDINSRQTFTGSFYQTGSIAVFSGCVGIGTNNPSKKLHVSGSGNNSGITFDVDTANTIIRGNTTSNFDLNNEGGGCLRLYGSEVQLRTSTVDPAVIIKNTGETCFACTTCAPTSYIANCLLINQVSSYSVASTKVEMSGIGDTQSTTQASYNVYANHGTNSSWIGYLTFNKSRGITQGSVTAVASGDRLGMIRFNGADGTEQTRAAEIYTEVDGTVSKCCVPGRIVFATSPTNAIAPIERLRIMNNGIACFACQVCSPRFQADNYGIFRSSAFRGGLFTYDGVSGAGTDYSPTIFAEGGAGGGNFYITTGGSATINMAMFCSGITCFRCQVCAPSGVKFGNGACTINHYEEGRWCIYACGSSSGAGAVGEGSYTRVGRLVTATIYINSQTFPSYSGVLRLSLPYTAGSGGGISGNLAWTGGTVYFYPFSAWCSGTNFTSLDATVLNSTNYAVLALGNVNGDRQGSVSSNNTATSGAGGLYLRFTITYEA